MRLLKRRAEYEIYADVILVCIQIFFNIISEFIYLFIFR